MAVLSKRVKMLPRGTQKVVAELAGLSAETITRWKGGHGNPRLGDLEAFADVLGVSVAYLVDAARVEAPKIPPTSADGRRLERLVRDGERIEAELPKALDAVRGRTR
jgi:transcriptional regulator with XRE-family HTH domain